MPIGDISRVKPGGCGYVSAAYHCSRFATPPPEPDYASGTHHTSPSIRCLRYEELAFHLEDSASFRAFARLPMGWTPKKAVLQQTISTITAASWEAINQTGVRSARQTRLEPAAMVRIDSTVVKALMHEPSDSSLLWDAVRVMTRLLKRADRLAGSAAISGRDYRRLAKKRAHGIPHSRGKQQKAKLYRELIAATRATKAALERALVLLTACVGPAAAGWCCEVR